MDLEILYRGARAGRIQLARTIVTADAGQIHPLDVWGDGLALLWRGARDLGLFVDGGVAHHAFEAVAGVLGEELSEPGCEPGGGWRLGG